MFIPFYPGVFFATVHPSVPTHMVLMHETFHFNEHGSWIGWPLVEGIADSIARRLSLEHGLVTQRQLRRWSTYGKERRVVGYLVERIAERTGQTREAALDTLVAWSVTGDRSRLEQILGAEAVGRVVEASRTASDWHWHLYERAVRAAVPPLEALAEPEGQPAQRNEPDTDAARRDEVVGLRPVELVRPEYPTIARQLEETGRVVALVTVTSAGRVRIDDLECHLDGGIRYRYQCSPLLTATKRALKQWRYSPGLLDGRTVDVHFPVAVDFDLVSGEPVVTLSETPGPDGGPLDHPVCFRMELPLYPPRARQRGTAGWVVARARLDGEGIVRSPTIVRSRPPSVFDESVLAAIPKWRYRKDWKEPQATREIEIQVHFQHAPCDGVESVGILDTDMDHVDVLVVCTGEGLEAD
jgi:TonB family protein